MHIGSSGSTAVARSGEPWPWRQAADEEVDLAHARARARQETFGPLVPVFRVDTPTEVAALANIAPCGLVADFCTQGLARVQRVAGALACGIVGTNEGARATGSGPFGGVEESGYGRDGSRDGSRDGLDDCMHTQTLRQGQRQAPGPLSLATPEGALAAARPSRFHAGP